MDVVKFKYAISLLQKDAYDWWVRVLNAKVKPPVFLGMIFLRNCMKYVSPAYCYAKKKMIFILRKRGISIDVYQQKFLRLSRYAGGITKKEKVSKDGLNDSIRKNVVLHHENRF